jgi:hypothetical protein
MTEILGQLAPETINFIKKCSVNFPYFAFNLLKIKTKSQGIKPLKLNKHQHSFFHFQNKCKKEGKFKFVVLKARQLGISTYSAASFFHKLYFEQAKNAFILADKAEHSRNIFEMVQLFHEALPVDLQHLTDANSRNRLSFSDSKSLFRIGTAGNENTGVSATINYFHGSEVARWDNADELTMSIFPAIQETPENEIILESTAKGIGNFFHSKVLEGLDPKSGWKTFFIPWHSTYEYSIAIQNPEEFILTDEEIDLKRLYDLTDEQINFRRIKIKEDFDGNEIRFKREYPASIQEAFETSSRGLIHIDQIKKARANKKQGTLRYSPDVKLPRIGGLDPARLGGDRIVLAVRQGRILEELRVWEKLDTVQLANMIRKALETLKLDFLFIDYAYGYGAYDILPEYHRKKILLVNFGSQDVNYKYKEICLNKRAEMHYKMQKWFAEEGGVSIPDSDQLEMELASLPYFEENLSGKFKMVEKTDIRKTIGLSPDLTDAIALTFADDSTLRKYLEDQENKRDFLEDTKINRLINLPEFINQNDNGVII